jgi:hypothetical protein
VCGCGQRGVQRRDKIEKERSVEQTKRVKEERLRKLKTRKKGMTVQHR